MGLGVFYGQRVGLMVSLASVLSPGQFPLWQLCDQFTDKVHTHR